MAYATIAQLFCFGFIAFRCVYSENINLLECPPPDTPEFGGYGPIQPYYFPGDAIHYFCATNTYMSGSYLRHCLESGHWYGDAPVCDRPEKFTYVSQTTTAEPMYKNEAESASDGARGTCSSTEVGSDNVWTGTLPDVTQVIRVMLFLPIGDAAYEVFAVRPDGTELSCGGSEKHIARLEWIVHNCPGQNNVGMSSIKIKSKSSKIPLRLCEVVTHVLTGPVCTDPHMLIENGHLTLSRKGATLVCNRGFTKSQDATLKCIKTGVWQLMYCTDDTEVEHLPPHNSLRDQVEHLPPPNTLRNKVERLPPPNTLRDQVEPPFNSLKDQVEPPFNTLRSS